MGSVFSFRNRKKHEKNKNMVKNAHFYHFSQTTSDCHFLGSLFSFRKRYKHEINKNIFKNAHFYQFSQATSDCHFWGSLFSFRKRYKHENNKNMVKTHFFSFSPAQYGHLAVYKHEEYFACSLKVQRSSIVDGKRGSYTVNRRS